MIQVFFLLLAVLTVFLSYKLSYYADLMNKTTKISGALIGGILLAGITSLPELVTCFSSIYLGNTYLAIGDILGSNLFNISIMCFLDIIFIKKMMFNKISNKKNLIYILILINYIFIYLSLIGLINLEIFNMGFASLVIVVMYIFYLFYISKDKREEKSSNVSSKNIITKFILTAISIIIVSICLTFTVNEIAKLNPNISSSFIGAVFLGIITSLPEVITFFSLIKLGNYNMALLDIIGSNLFNLFVLALGDIFISSRSIYLYSDLSSVLVLILGGLTTLINLFQINRKKVINKILYIIPSIIIVSIYLYFWFVNLTK